MFNFLKRKEEKPVIAPNPAVEKGSLLCPKCKVTMNKAVYKNVVMDVCPKCNSKFLDDGELEKIEEFKDFKI